MSNKILHYQSDNKNDNYAYARCYVEPFKPIDKLKQIGDGTFDLIMKQDTSYEGLVKMGTLCDETGEEYPLPVKPWTSAENSDIYNGEKGNIPIYNGNKKYIGNTSKNSKNILQWHKFLDKDKYIYICDRGILMNIDIQKLYNMGLINKIIKIDNKYYLCRVPTMKEYKDYIVNLLQIQQMPILDSNCLYNNISKDLNNIWNYYGIYTLCYENNTIYKIGFRGIINESFELDNSLVAWRPLLEEIEYNFIKTSKTSINLYNSNSIIDLNKINDIEYLKQEELIRTL